MSRNGKLLKNLFSRIQIHAAPSGAPYHLLRIEELERGEYELRLGLNSGEKTVITITVHKGHYWQDNFILKKGCIIENTAKKSMISLENMTAHSTNDSEKQL